MRPTLASASTPLLILGAVLVSTLIVWLSHPSDPAPLSQSPPVLARKSEPRQSARFPRRWEQGQPVLGAQLSPEAQQALDLLASWLRENQPALQAPEPRGTEAGATSG